MAWDPESRLQARDVKLCVAGMSHLFPSDGSEEKVDRGQRINSPGTSRPCFVALRGDARASHVTPVAAAGARGTPGLRSSPVCVLVCRGFFFFPLKCLHGFVYSSRRQGCLTGQLFPLTT